MVLLLPLLLRETLAEWAVAVAFPFHSADDTVRGPSTWTSLTTYEDSVSFTRPRPAALPLDRNRRQIADRTRPLPWLRSTFARNASRSRNDVMCATFPEVTCSTRRATRRGGWARNV